MIASTHEHAPGTGGLAPAFAAARTRLGLIALLFGLAAVGWWWTADEMQGMDGGPWTDLGTLAWFAGVWVVMMAAMMFPSVSPTVALYSSMTKSRSPVAPLLFTSGYLVAWTSVGVFAFAVATAGSRISGDLLAWDRAGRWIAGATLIVAAVYELTPLKDVCLGKCRSPLGFLLGSWRSGRAGALLVGRKTRRLVHRLLLGADGIALRARGDEHRLDGRRRRAHRVREAASVPSGSDLRHGRHPACARCAHARRARRDPCAHRPEERLDVSDGPDEPVARQDEQRLREQTPAPTVVSLGAARAGAGAQVDPHGHRPAGGKGIEEVVWVAQLDTLRGPLSRQDPKPFLFFTRTAKVAPKRRWAVQATRVVHTTGAGDSGVGRSPVGRHRARGSTVARSEQ